MTPKILVLGIGNILWADEGFGVRAVEQFHARYRLPENVSLLDGGTQGFISCISWKRRIICWCSTP
jgi:hydrogenase maturation protease